MGWVDIALVVAMIAVTFFAPAVHMPARTWAARRASAKPTSGQEVPVLGLAGDPDRVSLARLHPRGDEVVAVPTRGPSWIIPRRDGSDIHRRLAFTREMAEVGDVLLYRDPVGRVIGVGAEEPWKPAYGSLMSTAARTQTDGPPLRRPVPLVLTWLVSLVLTVGVLLTACWWSGQDVTAKVVAHESTDDFVDCRISWTSPTGERTDLVACDDRPPVGSTLTVRRMGWPIADDVWAYDGTEVVAGGGLLLLGAAFAVGLQIFRRSVGAPVRLVPVASPTQVSPQSRVTDATLSANASTAELALRVSARELWTPMAPPPPTAWSRTRQAIDDFPHLVLAPPWFGLIVLLVWDNPIADRWGLPIVGVLLTAGLTWLVTRVIGRLRVARAPWSEPRPFVSSTAATAASTSSSPRTASRTMWPRWSIARHAKGWLGSGGGSRKTPGSRSISPAVCWLRSRA